jgi:hypothetical protein
MHNAAAAAFILDVLRQLPDITIRLGELGVSTYGAVSFANRVITISNCVTPNEFRSTLVYQLVHLWRGPRSTGDEECEARWVATATALLLVPPEQVHLPADPHEIADAFCVDYDTAVIALRVAQRHHKEVA